MDHFLKKMVNNRTSALSYHKIVEEGHEWLTLGQQCPVWAVILREKS